MLTWMPGDYAGGAGAHAGATGLPDGPANTIGALLMHLAATETYDWLHKFDGMRWETGRPR